MRKDVSGEAMNPKISICIPVFNVGFCLGSCLESVINQTMKDIEIICVEDCSSDNSFEILKMYAAIDPRIKIIRHDKNLGTLVSRKDGAMAAQGKYIMYVDGDDELFSNACDIAFNLIEKNHTDVAEFGVQVVDSSGEIKQSNYFKINNIDRVEDINLLHLKMKGQLRNWQVWNKIYRSSLLKKAFCEIENEYSVLADDFRIFCVFGYYAQSVSMTQENLYKWKWGYGIWSGVQPVIDLNRYKKMLTEKDDLDAVVRFLESKPDKEAYRLFLQNIRKLFLRQTFSWWSNNLAEKEEGLRLFIEKWGTGDARVALIIGWMKVKLFWIHLKRRMFLNFK